MGCFVSHRFVRWISLSVVISLGSCTLIPWAENKRQKNPDGPRSLKMVWLTLDGFQPEALEPWVGKLKSPHARGLRWLLNETHGRKDLKVINPTITAPSHISTITCGGAGAHGIMDNVSWTGTGTVSGFNRPYEPENWVSRLRKDGLRVGSSLYPSIDGQSESRTADAGIFYDNPGSQPQILTIGKGATQSATIPDRAEAGKSFPIEVSVSAEGVVTAKTPWGSVGPLASAVPADIAFRTRINGVERGAAVSFLLVSAGDKFLVEVSPVQIMPAFGAGFTEALDQRGIVFSGLRDYRIQSNTASYISTLDHRRKAVIAADHLMLARGDLDALFLYFEDLDALLHAYYRDDVNETAVVEYLDRFDQDLGQLLSTVPATADLVVLGDHGMSAIAYVLNARKILTEAVASKGTVMTGGGAVYLYPPQGDITRDPPSDLDLNAVAETLRAMDFDLTGAKFFGKVIVRGSKEAEAEGLNGNSVPWIMAFANDGVAFKNSVEDKLLLARAKWAVIPEALKPKYPDPMNNGVLVVPLPAGQHGHWNELPQMRTRLVLEGPRASKLDPQSIERTLQLVPLIADLEGWARPAGCAR